MSIIEAPENQSIERHEGLSISQKKEAEYLQEQRGLARRGVEYTHSGESREAWNRVFLGFIPGAIERAFARRDARKADLNAVKHYEDNKVAYQEQATKDDAGRGAEISSDSNSK